MSWHLKSLATRKFVQQLIQDTNKVNIKAILAFVIGTPSKLWIPHTKGQSCRKHSHAMRSSCKIWKVMAMQLWLKKNGWVDNMVAVEIFYCRRYIVIEIQAEKFWRYQLKHHIKILHIRIRTLSYKTGTSYSKRLVHEFCHIFNTDNNKSMCQLTVAESCIYASVNMVIIGSGNGLVPNRQQAITWTNDDWLYIGALGKNSINTTFIVQENIFQNVVCKMSAILSRPRCVKWFASP